MSKLFLLAVVVAIGILIFTGVLEVKVHPEQLANVFPALAGAGNDNALVEKARVQTTTLKRQAEQLIIQDDEKKLELAVVYVQEDAQRLQELMAEDRDNPTNLMPQAKLLLASIERVRSQAQEAPVKVVADLKSESKEAFTQAHEAYASLKELRSEYAPLEEEFTRLTRSLEEQVGTLTTSENDDGVVAGEQTKQTETIMDEQPPIPLKF